MATEIKVPGVFTTGTGSEWGKVRGLHDDDMDKDQSAINKDMETRVSALEQSGGGGGTIWEE